MQRRSRLNFRKRISKGKKQKKGCAGRVYNGNILYYFFFSLTVQTRYFLNKVIQLNNFILPGDNEMLLKRLK